ncbi:MAG: transcription-repair coupling factor [Thermomicrobiales bacterium]
MTLAHLIPQLTQFSPLQQALDRVRDGKTATFDDLPDAARAALIAATASELERPLVLVTARRDRADALASAISEYLQPGSDVFLWPAADAMPFEQLPIDLDASVRRVQQLATLRSRRANVIVTPVSGLMQLVMPRAEMAAHTLTVDVGARLSIDDLMAWALSVGFQVNPLVQEPGTIARRGGIVDLFPPGSELPIRIDFFGDEVDSIRRFDPHNQRSTDKLRRLTLLPPLEVPTWRLREIAPQVAALDITRMRNEVREEWLRMQGHLDTGTLPASLDVLAGYLVPERTTLLDYVPDDALFVIDQPASVLLAATQREHHAFELLTNAMESGELPPGLQQPFLPAADLERQLSRRATLNFGAVSERQRTISAVDLVDPPLYAGRIDELASDLQSRLEQGWAISIATDQVDRLTELLEDRGVYPRRDKRSAAAGALPPALLPGTVEVRPSDLTAGWAWNGGKLGVWTDFEIFGFRKQPRRQGGRTVSESRIFAQSLEPGEFVVHVDHGVAKFTGLVRVTTGGVEREYLLLEYEKGDKLYVPVDQSDRVTRYGSGGVTPPLNRLGSGEWVKTKRRVRRAVREMAFELIQLYAYRESGHGHQFPADAKWDYELAESFPYKETADQQKAIDAVKADMESSKPMDRLVCGDVGFGKTEVAIRAAFKAVNGGKQVAVLVPTTVLALQHFTSFMERLSSFPIRVEMLSRLRSKKEQDKIIDGLRDGSVDIVIGTHRLVQKDVQFKDLGLVVVDEEQRFGVRQKEFLKQLRTEVDVLSMSATPIPRTLNMSMSGLRDISMIETAPRERLPIRTFVTAFSDSLVREVILREIERGGQVYVVHNRVHDIDRLADRLRKIVPEARFGIGHGQMDEHVLEEVMLGFVRRDFDVLIATTIIESGVDIPNANTIIIDNADTLGLTQLYQLRGRVGRSNHRAYAYLLYAPHKTIREEAQERLETIQEATELGAGLRVAMRDLEIRGAGNILGGEQSGHIATVGYDLYMRLLRQAIEEIRAGAPAIEQGPVTLDLPMTALIPEQYVQDPELRLGLYRQIAGVTTLDQVDDFGEELEDRFGEFPEEIEHLLALIRVRIRSEALGIDSVVEREREIVVRPVITDRLDKRRLVRELGMAVKITANSVRIRLLDLQMPWQDALDLVLSEVERVHERDVTPVLAAG